MPSEQQATNATLHEETSVLRWNKVKLFRTVPTCLLDSDCCFSTSSNQNVYRHRRASRVTTEVLKGNTSVFKPEPDVDVSGHARKFWNQEVVWANSHDTPNMAAVYSFGGNRDSHSSACWKCVFCLGAASATINLIVGEEPSWFGLFWEELMWDLRRLVAENRFFFF